MIKIVVGPPGAGKGLWLIQMVVDVLLDSNKTIITNFAIRLPELNVWLQKHHPEASVNLHERIVFLPEDEVKEFYLWRSNGVKIQAPTKEMMDGNEFQDYAIANQHPSVCYVLDEADIYFGAREYASHGRAVNFYNKQHRKLGDSVYYCCQATDQIDKQIRLLTQETIILKNLSKQKKGIFKLPALFCWSQYYQVPKQMDKPMCSGTFRLEVGPGLKECYETAAGVGMEGMKADRGERAKGVHYYWLIPAVIVAAILVVKVPFVFGQVFASATIGASSKAAQVVRDGALGTDAVPLKMSMAGVPPEAATLQQPAQLQGSQPAQVASKPAQEEPKVYLSGVVRFGGQVRIYLSDGREFLSDDPRVQLVTKKAAKIDGQWFDFEPPQRQQPQAQQSQMTFNGVRSAVPSFSASGF